MQAMVLFDVHDGAYANRLLGARTATTGPPGGPGSGSSWFPRFWCFQARSLYASGWRVGNSSMWRSMSIRAVCQSGIGNRVEAMARCP